MDAWEKEVQTLSAIVQSNLATKRGIPKREVPAREVKQIALACCLLSSLGSEDAYDEAWRHMLMDLERRRPELYTSIKAARS